MAFILNDKDEFLLFEQCINSPLVQKICVEEAQWIVQSMLDFFEKGKEHKIFKQIDTHLIFIYAFSALIQIAKKYYCGEFVFTCKNMDEIIQMSWDSVKAQ